MTYQVLIMPEADSDLEEIAIYIALKLMNLLILLLRALLTPFLSFQNQEKFTKER